MTSTGVGARAPTTGTVGANPTQAFNVDALIHCAHPNQEASSTRARPRQQRQRCDDQVHRQQHVGADVSPKRSSPCDQHPPDQRRHESMPTHAAIADSSVLCSTPTDLPHARHRRCCCCLTGSFASRSAPFQRSRCWLISPSIHHCVKGISDFSHLVIGQKFGDVADRLINDAASKTKDVIANLMTRRGIIRKIQSNTITA